MPLESAVATHAAVPVLAVVLVVAGGELFTTGTEWTSERLGLGRGATGSVFAALATTVPETVIPVLAILQGSGETVGVGALLGGPVTLTTLAAFLLGAAATVSALRGQREPSLSVNGAQVRRDLLVFLAGFSVAGLTALLDLDHLRAAAGVALVALYGWYLHRVVRRGGSEAVTDPEALELGKPVAAAAGVVPGLDADREHDRDPPTALVAVQVLAALVMLLVGSQLLVEAIEAASNSVVPLPPILVALVAAPVVSNLPENVDGVIWVTRRQDSLAVEQLTGTLAFQGTLGVLVGVWFTPWDLRPTPGTADFLVVATVVLSLLSGAVLFVHTDEEGTLSARLLMGLGLFYLLFVAVVVYYLAAGHL